MRQRRGGQEVEGILERRQIAGGEQGGGQPELLKESRGDRAVGRRGRLPLGEAGRGGGVAGFAQQGDIKALRVGGVLVHPERAFAAGEFRRGENEAGERLQRDQFKAEPFNGKTDLPFVLVHIGRAGGIDELSAGAQQAARFRQELALQIQHGLEAVALPTPDRLRVLVRGSPAGTGRIKEDGIPRGVGQGQGLAGP